MSMEQFSQALGNMDPVELALGAGFAGIIATMMAVSSLAWFFISALGFRKMYMKAGEAGWKAFVPYYRSYIRFKFAWNTKLFWPYLAGLLIVEFMNSSDSFVSSLICLAAVIVFVVIGIKLDIRVAKSFGKTKGWGVLLFFFPFIVSLILGYGKAEYIGNTTVEAAE